MGWVWGGSGEGLHTGNRRNSLKYGLRKVVSFGLIFLPARSLHPVCKWFGTISVEFFVKLYHVVGWHVPVSMLYKSSGPTKLWTGSFLHKSVPALTCSCQPPFVLQIQQLVCDLEDLDKGIDLHIGT